MAEKGSYALQYPLPDVNRNKIITELSRFTERFIHEDGSVAFIIRNDNRFLEAGFWNVGMFQNIEQFKENVCGEFGCKNRPLHFEFSSETINVEVRFIVYHKVFGDEWSVANLLVIR